MPAINKHENYADQNQGGRVVHFKTFLLTFTSAALFVACTTTVREPAAKEASADGVLTQLEAQAALAVNAQRELAMTANAKAMRELALRKRLLSDAVSYDFYGDVEKLLAEIALRYGYQFEVYGPRPAERVMVNVYVQKKPVLDVLRNVGYQANDRLDVKLTQTSIELHYKKN